MNRNKCRKCGSEMRSRRENRQYRASGLDNVTLVGVEVLHCPKCGEEDMVISRIMELHRTLAMALAEKPEKLTPKEIRFLRTHLGLSGVGFARRMGVSKQAASRWERVDKPLGMKTGMERLLRLMVLHEQPVDHYPLEKLDDTATQVSRRRTMLRMKSAKGGGWRSETAAVPAP